MTVAAGHPGPWRLALVVLASALVIGLAGLLLRATAPLPGAATSGIPSLQDGLEPPSIIVLPFENLGELAEAAVSEALSISPNYADGYGLMALIKNALGDSQAAIELIEKGMRLNPYYTWDYPYNLGRAYYALGRTDAAITALEDARNRNGSALPVRLYLAASYVQAGRLGDAEWEVQEILVLNPFESIALQHVTHPVGDREGMRSFVADLRAAGLPE